MAGQAAGITSSSSDLDAGMDGYPHTHSLDSNEGDRARSGSDAGQAKRGGGLFGMISSVVGGGGKKDDKGPLQVTTHTPCTLFTYPCTGILSNSCPNIISPSVVSCSSTSDVHIVYLSSTYHPLSLVT